MFFSHNHDVGFFMYKLFQVNYNNLLKMEISRLEFGSFKTFTNITNGFVMDIISLSSFIMVGLSAYERRNHL